MFNCNDTLHFCNYSLIHFNWNNLLTCQQISIDVIVKIMCNTCIDTRAWIACLMKRYSIIKKKNHLIKYYKYQDLAWNGNQLLRISHSPNLLSVECKELQSFWLHATSSYENSQHPRFASLFHSTFTFFSSNVKNTLSNYPPFQRISLTS